MAEVVTEPSIKVVPAGRCSSMIRKSRSHSGVSPGIERHGRDGDLGLAPERDLGGQVLERGGIDHGAKPDRQHLAVELGGSRIIARRLARPRRDSAAPGRARNRG